MKDELLAILEEHFTNLKNLLHELESIQSTYISRVTTQETMKSVCRIWFDKVKPRLEKISIDSDLIEKHSKDYEQLLKYSRKSSFKQSVIRNLEPIIEKFEEDFVHPIEIDNFDTNFGLDINPYVKGLQKDEKKYLEEAVICAKNNCIRACIILGWCAMINHIHLKLFDEGLNNFSQATTEMKARKYGRFKRFNKEYKIDSISELREVFDTDLLWILEYKEYIDKNQHERLRNCFTFRNNAAHPGEAPITPENLYSFYSDIAEIVLKNGNFNLSY